LIVFKCSNRSYLALTPNFLDCMVIRSQDNCFKADPQYGKGVAAALGLSINNIPV
jgi:hypothetical protein